MAFLNENVLGQVNLTLWVSVATWINPAAILLRDVYSLMTIKVFFLYIILLTGIAPALQSKW